MLDRPWKPTLNSLLSPTFSRGRWLHILNLACCIALAGKYTITSGRVLSRFSQTSHFHAHFQLLNPPHKLLYPVCHLLLFFPVSTSFSFIISLESDSSSRSRYCTQRWLSKIFTILEVDQSKQSQIHFLSNFYGCQASWVDVFEVPYTVHRSVPSDPNGDRFVLEAFVDSASISSLSLQSLDFIWCCFTARHRIRLDICGCRQRSADLSTEISVPSGPIVQFGECPGHLRIGSVVPGCCTYRTSAGAAFASITFRPVG